MSSDGERAVWNCRGTTEQSASEMALFKLRKFQEEQTTEELTKQ